jgi:GNAT superfamily N-acetyltransferase
MKFEIGCDLREFRNYYDKVLADGFKGDLEQLEKETFLEDKSNLIVWRDNDEIIGHAVWHESSTDEHRNGDPREEEDSKILEDLLGGKHDVIELHEVWLRKAYRGKGFGNKFFEFFEDLMRKNGYQKIVYYTDHPAAVRICRRRGWKESDSKVSGWNVFYLSLKWDERG